MPSPGVLLALAMAAAPAVVWDYAVDAGGDGRVLSVSATLAAGEGDLGVDEGMGRFVRNAQVRTLAGTWAPLAARGDGFAPCAARPCEVRYQVALAEAATALADRNIAFAQDGAFIAPPSSWLLR